MEEREIMIEALDNNIQQLLTDQLIAARKNDLKKVLQLNIKIEQLEKVKKKLC